MNRASYEQVKPPDERSGVELLRGLGVMVLLCRVACVPAEAAEVEIANRQLRVSLDLPSGLLTARDLRNDLTWRQYVPVRSARGRKWGKLETRAIPPGSLIRLTDAIVEGQSIKAKATWKGHPFEIVFRLAPDGPALSVSIDTANRDQPLPWKPNWAGVMLMTYPYAFHNDAAGPDSVVPIDEGVIYSTYDVDPLLDYRRWNGWWLHQKLSMPWWGVTDGERGVMTQVDTPYDCMFSIQWVKTPKGERTLPQVTWVGSKCAFAYPRRVTFHFFAKGGYVAMAKAFRRGEQARGAFRSWDEKVRANPMAGRLKGALDVWHQSELTPRLIAELRRAGVRRAIVAKPRGGDAEPTRGIEREAIGAAVEAGYLIGGYHNFSWIQGRWVARDPSLEEAAILPPSGKPVYLKNAWDAKGRLNRCPAVHRGVFFEMGRSAREAGLNYFFADCTTTGGAIHECYSRKHPMRRSEGAAQLNEALRAASDHGLVVGSERGKWWAAASTHVFEGIETLSEYGGQYYGSGGTAHWVGPYLTDKPGFQERCLGYDFNPARRLPLFQLVYHDSVYCTRRWNQDPGRDSGLWDRHDLMNILYGTASLFFMHPKAGNVIGSPEWEKVKDRYLQTYSTVCGWHEKIGFDEMIGHRFLSEDRLVQQTRFASGWTVVVNFSDRTWRDSRGAMIQAHSYHTFH